MNGARPAAGLRATDALAGLCLLLATTGCPSTPAAQPPKVIAGKVPSTTTPPPPTPNVVVAMAGAVPGGVLTVDPGAGRNNFTAVFDAPLGERITASSSAVDCTVTFDDHTNSFSGQCSVALPTIMVDSDATKTDHFQQWITNKKTEPRDCRLEARFEDVKLASPLAPGAPAHFVAEVPFTVCGRARVDGGREHVEGTALLLPIQDEMPTATLRVRAQIDGFSRDRYHIGPAYTDGWLARVQKYAAAVADSGSISLSLFARGRE